jgi:hypothetical protein
MLQTIFLSFAGAIYLAYAYLIFGSKMDKEGMLFFVISMIVGTLYSLLWYCSARMVEDKNDFFFLVLLWDLIYILVFYFAPVALFGLKLDNFGLIGLFVVVAGLLVMKAGHLF